MPAPHASEPIDAVVMWVDGDDPRHREKLDAYLATLGRTPRGASPSRFREAGEFAYCVASLIRFAPWLRRIHIVTDEQSPAFLDKLAHTPWAERIRVVDHREIFAGYERHLPSFNSRAIGTVLWRVPELSERYLFLNDDFFLLRPLTPSDFFREEGGVPTRLVLRGTWSLMMPGASLRPGNAVSASATTNAVEKRPQTKHAYAMAARLSGLRWRYLLAPHVPHPQLRSLLEACFNEHPEWLEANITPRLRSANQFLTDALCRHLAIREGRYVFERHWRYALMKKRDYQTPRRLTRGLQRMRTNHRLAFACLQDVCQASEPVRTQLLGWLNEHVGPVERAAETSQPQ